MGILQSFYIFRHLLYEEFGGNRTLLLLFALDFLESCRVLLYKIQSCKCKCQVTLLGRIVNNVINDLFFPSKFGASAGRNLCNPALPYRFAAELVSKILKAGCFPLRQAAGSTWDDGWGPAMMTSLTPILFCRYCLLHHTVSYCGNKTELII